MTSRAIYYTFLALYNIERYCTEASSILNPLFTKWDPYLQFFNRLVPLLTQFKELPKGTTISVRKLIGWIRDLNAFFILKLQVVQNKMRWITDAVELLIPSILNEDKTVKEWQAWVDSFGQILKHPKFLTFCNEETSIANVYEIIDNLYKIELDMSKFISESKAVKDAKWTKSIHELNVIRDATWLDIDTYLEIWEVVTSIKALPSGNSD